MLTAKRVRKVLGYDANTGIVTWRVRRGRQAAGKRAGWQGGDGHRRVAVDGTIYEEHRVIWLHVTGNWPAEQIDHCNGIRDDNRFANLREATHNDNSRNTKMFCTNTSGVKGVCWDRNRNKWLAHITVNDRFHHLGRFDSIEDAAAARLTAEKKIFGAFAPSLRAPV